MDGYRTLKAWQRCHELALAVYRISEQLPSDERFGLVSQMRRAAISACANLAEGYARRGRKELRRFVGNTMGSLAELDALLLLARDLGYVEEVTYTNVRLAYVAASKTTLGFLRSITRPDASEAR